MNTRRFVLFLSLTLGLAASEVRAQQPRGRDFRISPQIAAQQGSANVATAPDSSFVAVWREVGPDGQSGFVRARLFDAAGRPRGGQIQVARFAKGAFGVPGVAMAPDGRFVIAWQGGVEEPFLVFGRRFAADGRPLGPRFRLARNHAENQLVPDVAMAPDGSFVAVWYQTDGRVTEGPTTDVMVRRFDAGGRPRGPETVAIGGFEEQSMPQVALRPDGGFVVVCQSWIGESSFYDIKARLFSSSGAPLGDAFLVNDDSPTPEVSQFGPAVAVASDGRFGIAWTDRGADFLRGPDLAETEEYTGVAARFYAADGTALGPSVLLNTFLPGVQQDTAIAALPNRGFLVLWSGGAGQDGDGFGVFARVFGPMGRPRGQQESVFPENPAGSQALPAVSIAPNGRGIAVWSSNSGVFGRLLASPRRGPLSLSTPPCAPARCS